MIRWKNSGPEYLDKEESCAFQAATHMTACAHYSNEIGLQALRLENFPDFRGKQRLIVFTPKHVITGGRASDGAMRSLVISYKLLGTRE